MAHIFHFQCSFDDQYTGPPKYHHISKAYIIPHPLLGPAWESTWEFGWSPRYLRFTVSSQGSRTSESQGFFEAAQEIQLDFAILCHSKANTLRRTSGKD